MSKRVLHIFVLCVLLVFHLNCPSRHVKDDMLLSFWYQALGHNCHTLLYLGYIQHYHIIVILSISFRINLSFTRCDFTRICWFVDPRILPLPGFLSKASFISKRTIKGNIFRVRLFFFFYSSTQWFCYCGCRYILIRVGRW